jgi:uncharacterized NAD(P)/FAD-binding protein YdhS
VIAIIGGGASGTLATICLLREAAALRLPQRVALIDRLGRHGLGQAYSTTHPRDRGHGSDGRGFEIAVSAAAAW